MIASPTRWRGLSDSNGFWKTIWTRRRLLRACGRARARRAAAPSSRTLPAAGRCRPAMQRAIVVLPRARLADEREAADPAASAKPRSSATTTAVARRCRSSPQSPRPRAARRGLGHGARARARGSASASGGVRSPLEAAHPPLGRRRHRAAAAPRAGAARPARSAARRRSPAATRRRPRRPRASTCSRRGAAWSGIEAHEARACTDGAAASRAARASARARPPARRTSRRSRRRSRPTTARSCET